MKTYKFVYQETFVGRIEVKAKSKKQAREKAQAEIENSNGEIISSELELNLYK